MDPVSLPIPPSVNGLWRAIRRRGNVAVVRSAAYKAWFEPAVLLLRVGVPALGLVCPVSLSVVIRPGKGWRRDRDLDNCLKAVADALVHAGRIPDDSCEYVGRVACELGPPDPSGTASCLVTVEPLTP